jgi:NAD(P)-dependent dehydrogenase (short-subunit alcohol dehydrogenase family)
LANSISIFAGFNSTAPTNNLRSSTHLEVFTMTRKIALITGASRGLGRNAAEHLAARGIDVIGTYHSKADEAQAVVARLEQAGAKAAMLQLNVGDSSSFASFAERLGTTLQQHFGRERFDFLVNNAGIGLNVPYVETSEAQFDQLLNIQLKGPFFLTQRLLPLLVDNGRIVNISTGLARFALPGYAAYAAMKGAMEVLTRYQAKELGARGIRVNILAPGAIETDFGGGVVRDNQQVNEYIAGNTALGRVGLPDDIGAAIALLLEDGNGWITGQRLEVSGGMFL